MTTMTASTSTMPSDWFVPKTFSDTESRTNRNATAASSATTTSGNRTTLIFSALRRVLMPPASASSTFSGIGRWVNMSSSR